MAQQNENVSHRERYLKSQEHTDIFGIKEQKEVKPIEVKVLQRNQQSSASENLPALKGTEVAELDQDQDEMGSKSGHNIPSELSKLCRSFPNVHALFHWNNPNRHGSAYSYDFWKWNDPGYVKLPLSKEYQKKRTQHGKSELVPKWGIIEEELTKFKSVIEHPGGTHKIGDYLKTTISKYNSSETRQRNFDNLNRHELRQQLIAILPSMIDHACALKHRLAKPIPILSSGVRRTIYVTQSLACSILANAFFCTFPKDSSGKLPGINFYSLYDGGTDGQSDVKLEKLKCILNYFQRMKRHKNDGMISFEKRCLHRTMNWKESDELLSTVKIHMQGRIEDAENMLQVDFANKYIGGGILGDGMVQEEIRFSICPELIVSRLFTEVLKNDEVLVINGCEQFSRYSGYGSSFKYSGNYDDTTRTDSYGRRKVEIVAMDAYHFKRHEKEKQFEQSMVDRELKKCYCAFEPKTKHVTPIATGNWGCGAFNGDLQLKFLIQWMAASEAKQRELHFYTFKSKEQYESIIRMVKLLKDNNVTVGKLYKAIKKYDKEIKSSYSSERESLFSFVKAYCLRKGFIKTLESAANAIARKLT